LYIKLDRKKGDIMKKIQEGVKEEEKGVEKI
jgi:hypothetical protein